MELLSNATTIDSALNYIKSKQHQQQKKHLSLDLTSDDNNCFVILFSFLQKDVSYFCSVMEIKDNSTWTNSYTKDMIFIAYYLAPAYTNHKHVLLLVK